jgi:hypothetical protein
VTTSAQAGAAIAIAAPRSQASLSVFFTLLSP